MYKVLIIEDDDIIRTDIAYTFDWLSFGCIVVGDAADGLLGEQMILQLKPDIVLTDINMPGQSGIEMLRRTREQVPYKSILVTSHARFEYAKAAIDLKVSSYLLKPLRHDQLEAAVCEITEELDYAHETYNLLKERRSGFDMSAYIDLASQENPYVLKALETIRDNYTQKLSIEEAAAIIGVSPSYLSRKFKEVTGHTYLDFLNRYRLSQAVKLLACGIYKIYEISEQTGFTDYKHFSSVFKKYTGISPTEFAKSAV